MTVVGSAQTTAPTAAPTDAPTSAPTSVPTDAPADGWTHGWTADGKTITRSEYDAQIINNLLADSTTWDCFFNPQCTNGGSTGPTVTKIMKAKTKACMLKKTEDMGEETLSCKAILQIKSKYAHNAGKIAGIVVGSVAFVAIAVGVGVWYNNNRKQQSVELQSGYGRFVF